MPVSILRLADLCLHDAELLAFEGQIKPDPPIGLGLAILSLRHGDEVVSLNYGVSSGVDILPPIDLWPHSDRKVHWLYDEVDESPTDPGVYLHRILWSDGRVVEIPFVTSWIHEFDCWATIKATRRAGSRDRRDEASRFSAIECRSSGSRGFCEISPDLEPRSISTRQMWRNRMSVDLGTYDDEYATCAKTYATLLIYPGKIDPSVVTERLGIEPTRLHRRGEPIVREGRRPEVAPISLWALESCGHVDSKDSRRHFDWLIDQVVPKAEAIRSLRAEACRIEISCYWISREGHGGPTLDPYQMGRLAELDIALWFDFYDLSDESDD